MDTQLDNPDVSFARCRISYRKISGLEILRHLESFVDFILDLRVVSPFDSFNLRDSIVDELPSFTYFLGMLCWIVQVVDDSLLRLGVEPVPESLDSPSLVI